MQIIAVNDQITVERNWADALLRVWDERAKWDR
jgi:hypothetical protein